MTRMWINLGKAFITALVVIALAEWLAQGVMGRAEFAHSYDVSRNPNYRRAWPAYTEPRSRDANDKLVIVISNSQGFAHELDVADQCYTHLLEEQLNADSPDTKFKVANWSLGGVSGPEMLLLAARAVDHKPDAVLLVTHSNPFSQKRLEEPLSFYLSDAGQLAYQQPVRGRLPYWFIKDHQVYDPATFLETYCGLVRCRNSFVEQRHRRWHIASHNDRPRRGEPRIYHAPVVSESGHRMLNEFVEVLTGHQARTPILLVNMPLNRSRWTDTAWQRLQSFGQTMQDISDTAPYVSALNATRAIGEEHFLTHTHMSAQGHIDFADYLYPYVTELLEHTPRSYGTPHQSTTP